MFTTEKRKRKKKQFGFIYKFTFGKKCTLEFHLMSNLTGMNGLKINKQIFKWNEMI